MIYLNRQTKCARMDTIYTFIILLRTTRWRWVINRFIKIVKRIVVEEIPFVSLVFFLVSGVQFSLIFFRRSPGRGKRRISAWTVCRRMLTLNRALDVRYDRKNQLCSRRFSILNFKLCIEYLPNFLTPNRTNGSFLTFFVSCFVVLRLCDWHSKDDYYDSRNKLTRTSKSVQKIVKSEITFDFCTKMWKIGKF